MRRTPLRSRAQATKRPPEIAAHWRRVRALGCIVTGTSKDLTLHHVHSGSIAEIGVGRQKWKTSDWLCIPLAITLHSLGPEAIDGACGVLTWESRYGRQVDHVDEVCRRLGLNVWKRAGIDRGVEGVD